MKKLPREIENYFVWIRKQPCWFAGRYLDQPFHPQVRVNPFPLQCSQGWNEQTGEYISQVSHILKRRSVRLAEGEEHFGNVFPNCGGINGHHQFFESLPPEIRQEWREVGDEYYEKYLQVVLNKKKNKK